MTYNLPQNPDAPDGRMYMRKTVNEAQQLINESKKGDPNFYNANRTQIHRALRIVGNANAVNIADNAKADYAGAYDDAHHVAKREALKNTYKNKLQDFYDKNPEVKKQDVSAFDNE